MARGETGPERAKKTAHGVAITESGKDEKGLENPYFTPDYTTKTGAAQV